MTYDEALVVLSDFLSSSERADDCFNIHQFQGSVVAMLSSPEYVSEVELGFLVLGEEAKEVDQWFEDEQIRIAWVTCLNETDEALSMGHFALQDCYAISESATAPSEELGYWCDGYLQAYLLTEEAWEDVYDSLASGDWDELDKLNEVHMATLGMLAALADWDQALEDSEAPDFLRGSLPKLSVAIDEAVIGIYHLAKMFEENIVQSEGIEHETLAHESMKIGRNDPCPCGSGKKYKKCCHN